MQNQAAALIAAAAGVPERVAEAIAEHHELYELADLIPEQLTQHEGVSEARAGRIIAAAKLGRRAAAQPIRRGQQFRAPKEVWETFSDLRTAAKEEFHVATLDARARLIRRMHIHTGSITSSMVHPREVYRAALMANAAAIIGVHNHPSGDPTPSSEDWRITRRLEKAGALLGVPLLDHIVVADGGYASHREAGAFEVENFKW